MISKIQEIKMSYIALSTVMNDTYSLIESGKKLAFPEYAKHKSIPTYYPQIMSFALAEYQSLLMTFQSAVSANASSEEAFIIPLGPNALRRIEELLSKAIEELKS